MTQIQKRPIDKARERLKILSEEVKDLVEEGTFFTINDAIVETLYRDGTHREFKSYRQWRKEGFQVRKGEKAFLLWARPKDLDRIRKEQESKKTGEPVKEEDVEEMSKFFPLAYLFSNAQVDPMEKPKSETAKAEQKPKMELEPMPYG